MLTLIAPTRGTWAAHPPALAASDYPKGCRVAVLPATNAVADRYFSPAHRSTFEHLRRVDGIGWMQFASCSFVTGKGAARETHATLFGYGINVFSSKRAAAHAIADVKLVTHATRVGHRPARRFDRSTARATLHFRFFTVAAVEVEMYYEYTGAAPASVAGRLAHAFSRQGSHLANEARSLRDSLNAVPTATFVPTDTPTATATTVPPTATPTFTATFTAIPTATTRPTATPTATSAPIPSPTPIVLAVQAGMAQPIYGRGDKAVVNMTATENGTPAGGIQLTASFSYPTGQVACSTVSAADGQGTCSTMIPNVPDGTQVTVFVRAYGPNATEATASTTFLVHGG